MPKYGPPGILRLQELPDPRPGPGEVLVRVRAIGLNFADCAARLGVYPRVPKPPFVPGMEVSGEVAALGDGVDGPPIGTPVAAVPIFGGHAELVVVKAQSLRTMAGSIDFVTAAAVAVTSQYQAPVACAAIVRTSLVPGELPETERLPFE